MPLSKDNDETVTNTKNTLHESFKNVYRKPFLSNQFTAEEVYVVLVSSVYT